MGKTIQNKGLWLPAFLLCWFCKDIDAQSRVSNILLEPITYSAGPPFAEGVHAYITMDVLPGNELVYFNARLTNSTNNVTEWCVQNLPLLPADEPYSFSYIINVEGFGENYSSLRCAYTDTAWQTSPNFVTSSIITLIPMPVEYHVPSGSSDPPILIQGKPDKPKEPGKKPIKKETTYLNREKVMPNIDLDQSKDRTVYMACGPAAAANSLQWLKTQHKELQGDTTSLRSKTDSLKKYMNRSDAIGVRFDSMVVGKLTLIDQLKLPIKVKYKTKHESGNPEDPLKSTKPPFHTADNKGAKDVFPDFDWLKKEMDDGEDVEVHVGWYGPPDKNGVRERKGGHWLVASGYSIVKKDKGIYVKDDNDHRKKGGLRSTYFRWKTLPNTGEPYLEDLKDDKGNIAIVESVVSESFDPTVMFYPGITHVSYPWTEIDLTSVEMKPGYPFLADATRVFPWIPIIAGAAAGGTAIYFLTKDDDEPSDDCSFTASAQAVASTCGLSNGEIVTSVVPLDDYTYVWSNGATLFALSEVPAGNYSVTITRTGTTCTQILTTTVTNSNPAITASIAAQDSDCDQQNGSATVTPSPPGTYTYVWSNGSTQQNQTGLAAGNYTVTVSAGGACEQSFSTQVGTTPFEPSVTFTTTPSTCGGSDGTALVMVDPTGLYTYAWSDGQSGPQATGLSGGSYTVTISLPGTSCTTEAEITVEELPASFSVVVTSTPTGCGLSDGTATVTVDPPGPYDITWSNGQTGSHLSGVAAGDYTVTVSLSGFNCSQEASVTIGSDPFPYSVSLSTTPAHCGAADGSASVIVTPQGEFGIQWSNGGNGTELTGLSAGSYTVTITDVVTSCAEEFTVTVDELPADIVLTFTTTPAGCGVSDGSATVNPDPPGAFTFLWSNGHTTSQLTGVPSGTYSVTVTIMGTMCSNTGSVEVEQTGGGFTASFTTVNADCGLATGSAVIDVAPAGEYTYQWSDTQSGPLLQQVSTDTYAVTVTDQNACTEVFSITVAENPPAFITIGNITPGTCTGGGEIIFMLTTPGTGPLEVEVLGPKGTFFISLTLAPGTYALSTFENLGSGQYSFFVFDQQVGDTCEQIVGATIPDISPPLLANDDFYETQAGVSIDANALDNDSGLSILMTTVSDVFGGLVTFLEDGSFTFISDPGFSGEASFVYTVSDDCGTTATANVIINVDETICDFSVEFETTPASCGLEDGAITVIVFEPGTYDYQWSNGETGPTISDIPAGNYLVTITDLNLGCDLTFTVNPGENPVEHISDIIITQPACGFSGEIEFTASTGSQNPLVMSVTHPNGSNVFFIDPGVIRLSDYISLTAGDYIIEVFDAGAGPNCFESFEVTLVLSQTIEIIAEAVIPPTEPTGSDGLAIIVAIQPGTLPYEILLNGDSWGLALDHTFQVSGLEVGEYTVQIIDANGCASNILVIIVPFPDIIFSFGTSVLQTEPDVSNDVLETYSPSTLWRQTLTASVKYTTGSVYQEVVVRYAAPVHQHDGFVELAYMTDLIRYSPGGVGLAIQGGAGGHFESDYDIKSSARTLPTYLLLKASGGYTVARRFRLQGSIEMRAWEKLETLRIEMGVSIPFVRSTFRWVN